MRALTCEGSLFQTELYLVLANVYLFMRICALGTGVLSSPYIVPWNSGLTCISEKTRNFNYKNSNFPAIILRPRVLVHATAWDRTRDLPRAPALN